MEDTNKLQVVHDNTTLSLLQDMERIRKEYGLKRIDSVILLKALLLEDDSVFYHCLSAISIINPYKGIINDCDNYLKSKKNKKLDKNSEERRLIVNYDEKSVPLILICEAELHELIVDSINLLISRFVNSIDNVNDAIITVNSENIFEGFLNFMPKDAIEILKSNGVNLDAIYKYYLTTLYEVSELQDKVASIKNNEDGNYVIPEYLSEFITDITSCYIDAEKSEILGRDKECKKIMRIMQKRGRKNVILLGNPGVGKSAIVERLAFDIAKGNCPDSLKNNVILQLNINSIIAGTTLRGMTEERIKDLVDFLEENDNVILFIDEMHTIVGAGSRDDSNDMANALKPFLASKKAKVIGATTNEEFRRILALDGALNRRFIKVHVKEPKAKDVHDMLKNAIEAHEKYHGVTISKEMVDYAILISSCFNHNTSNPDRTNDLIDVAMVIAKTNGKKEVDKESVLENFEINFEKYDKMDEKAKYATAYHEAGHYLVWRKSKTLKDRKAIAISIMPAEDYLGVTVYDDLSDDVTINKNRSYYIECIAEYLAGREAERIFTNYATSGASMDLNIANKMAYTLITEFGMGTENDVNVTYFEDSEYHMITEDVKKEISKQQEKIIAEATNLAKEILTGNMELLTKIANVLVEKGIIDENELNEICKES